MKFPKNSVALLIIQLFLVSLIAARYLYERITCPRVWTRTVAYDPSLLMRGRYLSLQITVDGCGNSLASVENAPFPRAVERAPIGGIFNLHAPQPVWFQAKLAVEGRRLIVNRLPDSGNTTGTQTVIAQPGAPCDRMRLADPVDFYIPEHGDDPSRLKPGQELWIEVTVPPTGPPRPLQLALKDNGAWKPLEFH